MKLTIQQKEAFLKKIKLQKQASISKYAIREIKILSSAYENIDIESKEKYTLEDIKQEIRRIQTVIKTHPRLKSTYENILNQYVVSICGVEATAIFIQDIFPYMDAVAIHNKKEVDSLTRELDKSEHSICDSLLKDILKLEAALGLPLNPKYSSIIQMLFQELYDNIMNDSYVDSYSKRK